MRGGGGVVTMLLLGFTDKGFFQVYFISFHYLYILEKEELPK